ncbi:MAG: cupin domain-containing protein [Kangiellaceae bacterium]|nr:cupin domain-containing protein [Kangiellaceae bacterium]
MSKLPIANINNIEKNTIGDGKNFTAKVGRFSPVLNMKQLGCSVVELQPSEKGWPYHCHLGSDEVFYIIKGCGTVRYDDEEYSVTTGDVIYTPAGKNTAHQIINTSDAVLSYLAIDSFKSPEVCYYPDSEKYGSYAQDSDGSWDVFLAPKSAKAEYYDGEDK